MKSPDETALYSCEVLMGFVYRKIGVSPLWLHCYPLQALLFFITAAYIDISVNIDRMDAVVAVGLVSWCASNWRANRSLRIDGAKEWDARLYKKYAASALRMRDRFIIARMGSAALAGFVTWLVLVDPDGSLAKYAPWHRASMVAFLWGIAFFAYMRSAEPPMPGDGDTVSQARQRYA